MYYILSWVRVMVFNATFNNISVISWQSVLSVDGTRVPEKTTDKFYHIKLYRVHLDMSVIRLTTFSGSRQ